MNPATPITVAIPTMNGAVHLRDLLAGVLAQSGVPFDLVVSDDRSDDATLTIIRELAGDRARVSVNPERLGLAGNWNHCVDLCQTPLIAIVHQDDRWKPGHLASQVAAFREGVGLVASASTVIDEHGQALPPSRVEHGGLGPRDALFPPGAALPRLASGNPLRCSAVALRVDAHRQAGGFDPSWKYVLDWDFWLKVARRWSVAWLARPSVEVRWHLASETHRFATGTADLEETQAILQSLHSEGIAVQPGLARLSRAYLNRAHVALRRGDGRVSRSCLIRAFRIHPTILGRLALDPRLATLLASAWVAPGWAGRIFRRGA